MGGKWLENTLSEHGSLPNKMRKVLGRKQSDTSGLWVEEGPETKGRQMEVLNKHCWVVQRQTVLLQNIDSSQHVRSWNGTWSVIWQCTLWVLGKLISKIQGNNVNDPTPMSHGGYSDYFHFHLHFSCSLALWGCQHHGSPFWKFFLMSPL